MGRNTHGNKSKRRALSAAAAGGADTPVAAPAPAEPEEVEEEDEEAHGGADPEEAAAAAADKTPADAALIVASREARRMAKKDKRRQRLAAEAAAAAAAVAAGLEAPLSAKEARRAERRRAEEERTAARAAKQAAWLEARAEREAAAAASPPAADDGGDGDAAGDAQPQPQHRPAAAAAAAAAPAAHATAAAADAAAAAAPEAKPQSEAKLPNTIFVGGLPFTKTMDEIRDYFGAFGEVADVDCLTFPDSGRFRGIALVRFADDAGFHAALALNGVEMEDRVLTVKRAKAKQAAEGGAAAKKAAPQVAPLPLDASSRVVYVGNLPWEVDEEVLAATFEGLPIESVTWGLDKTTGDFKGYAHVAFATAEDAAAAQQRNGADVLGRPMRVAPEVKRLVPRGAAAAGEAAPEAAAPPAGGIASASRAYVTGLPYDAEPAAVEAALRAAFAGCGAGAQRVRLGLDRASGAFRGYAHVDFADAAAMDAALALSGAVVCGRAARVTRAVDKPEKAGLQQRPPAAKGGRGPARGRNVARTGGGEA